MTITINLPEDVAAVLRSLSDSEKEKFAMDAVRTAAEKSAELWLSRGTRDIAVVAQEAARDIEAGREMDMNEYLEVRRQEREARHRAYAQDAARK